MPDAAEFTEKSKRKEKPKGGYRRSRIFIAAMICLILMAITGFFLLTGNVCGCDPVTSAFLAKAYSIEQTQTGVYSDQFLTSDPPEMALTLNATVQAEQTASARLTQTTLDDDHFLPNGTALEALNAGKTGAVLFEAGLIK